MQHNRILKNYNVLHLIACMYYFRSIMFFVLVIIMCKYKRIIGDATNMKMWLPDNSVQLVVTSPPYAHIKDYGIENQIGFNSSFEKYIEDLNTVWKECYRVLESGCRLVINVGDVYNTRPVLGRYKVLPVQANLVLECEKIGFDYMGGIIWQKVGNVNPSGGASVMGSFPYPRNGIVEYDYEFVLIFKKPGKSRKLDKRIKDKSKLSLEDWRKCFTGHWKFPGTRQKEHIAMFPEELPARIIKMFSFAAAPELGFEGDWVLDPFLGSGTTMKVAKELRRNCIGIELNPEFLPVIKKKVGIEQRDLRGEDHFEIIFE